ncbi:MAG: DUF5009 domain-containing protein [Myxococcales bacterium]|nr:MAG: DUF5009 domain-containing protein [Myxococcales bacterium]
MKSTFQIQTRLSSLDTLRGFDMFWVMGGDVFFQTLGKVTGWGPAQQWAVQMEHAEWQGFHFYDLLFPLFMFISGVAIPYSLLIKAESSTKSRSFYLGLIRRAFLLVFLGLVYNNFFDLDFQNQRYPSVLGQIGLAYLFAALIFLNIKSFKGRLAALIIILAGVAVLQLLVPVPGIGLAGVSTPESTINAYLDSFLPGKLYERIYDPEGILCIFSATSVTLMGGFAGCLLRYEKWNGYRKSFALSGIGIGLLVLGLILNNWYPIIKNVWTSTFDIYAAGWSFLLLALFYFVVDVWKCRKPALFFQVIGMNSITIYLANQMVNFETTSKFLFGGLARISGEGGILVINAGIIALEWLVLYLLYKKNVFLKV